MVRYKLDEDGQAVTIEVFVHDPHHELVRKNTRFWNASGLDVAIDAEGIRVDTESFVTLMIGGIAFDTPANREPGEPAEENDVFDLYKNRESISEKTYVRKKQVAVAFRRAVCGGSKAVRRLNYKVSRSVRCWMSIWSLTLRKGLLGSRF